MALRSGFARLVGVVALILCGAVSAHAQSATLAWDANTEPNVTGYKIYYGTKSRTYTKSVNVGKVTTYTVSGLDQSLDYYFAVQAYNSAGLSSAFSSEVKLPAPVPPGTTVISSFKANASYPLLIGKSVTWTAAATSKRGPVEYQFWMYSAGAGWVEVQPFSSSRTFTWIPGWDDLGTHSVQVWVRTVGSSANYEAWVGTPMFQVNATPLVMSADADFPAPPGQPVKWTATFSGGTSGVDLEYKFWVYDASTGWSVLRNYGASNSVSWTPSRTGSYSFQVWVRRQGSTANYETYAGAGPVTVSRSPLKVTGLSADRSCPCATGEPITWTARTRGGSAGPIQYEFWLYTASSGWTNVQPYSSSKSFTFNPTWGDEGRYSIQVWARSAGSTARYEDWKGASFDVTQAALQLTTTTLFPVAPGTNVRWTASVADDSVAIEYSFWLYSQSTGTWSNVQPYSATATFDWTPATSGTYAVQVWARRQGSTDTFEAWKGTPYLVVSNSPAEMVSLTPSVTLPTSTGTTVVWTAKAIGGTAGPLRYQFWVYEEGSGWTIARAYSTNNTFSWTPSAPGRYSFQVWVRSAGSTATYEGWMSSGVFEVH